MSGGDIPPKWLSFPGVLWLMQIYLFTQTKVSIVSEEGVWVFSPRLCSNHQWAWKEHAFCVVHLPRPTYVHVFYAFWTGWKVLLSGLSQCVAKFMTKHPLCRYCVLQLFHTWNKKTTEGQIKCMKQARQPSSVPRIGRANERTDHPIFPLVSGRHSHLSWANTHVHIHTLSHNSNDNILKWNYE